MLIVIVMLLGSSKSNFAPTEAHAIAPAVAAPAVAIGALELAALTTATAFALGAITGSQNESFQRQISELIRDIKTTTGEILGATLSEVSILLKKVSGGKVCKDANETAARRVNSCNSSPEACCGDYFSKFKNRLEKGRGGIRIFKNDHRNKLLCCLEWDGTHGGFEIFDDHGNHLGERGCEDLSDDPCQYSESRGRHAKPASSTHHTRSAMCGH